MGPEIVRDGRNAKTVFGVSAVISGRNQSKLGCRVGSVCRSAVRFFVLTLNNAPALRAGNDANYAYS